MFDIAKYLEKFKVMSNSKVFLKKTVAEAIKEVCGIEIEPQKIEIKNYLARINEKPIIKTQIFIKKTKLLEILNKKTEGRVTDIV